MKKKIFKSLHKKSSIVDILFLLHLTVGFLVASLVAALYPQFNPFWISMAWSLILVSLLALKMYYALDEDLNETAKKEK